MIFKIYSNEFCMCVEAFLDRIAEHFIKIPFDKATCACVRTYEESQLFTATELCANDLKMPVADQKNVFCHRLCAQRLKIIFLPLSKKYVYEFFGTCLHITQYNNNTQFYSHITCNFFP